MANSDKNILITPNTGSALNPTIAFTGSNASPITMSILDTGALSFSGTSGQLFSIVDSLSGSIFSVNDISGIPSLEILDTGLVKLNQYGGNATIGVVTPYTGLVSSGAARLSISTISAATAGLIVKGKPSQSENLVEFYRSSADASPVFKIQAGTYPVYIDNLAVGSNVYANYQIVGGVISGNMGNVLHQFNSWNAAWVTVGVRGAASQTANLQEWQNSAGTVLSRIGSDGRARIGGSNGIGTGITASTLGAGGIDPSWTVITAKGAASQTANLQEWQDSAGTVYAFINPFGQLSIGQSPTIYSNARISINTVATTVVGQVIRGVASQTANLQEWQNSAGDVVAALAINTAGGSQNATLKLQGAYGGIISNGEWSISRNGGDLEMVAPTNYLVRTAYAGSFIIRGAASQTANIQEWQSSAGALLARVTSSGGTSWYGGFNQFTGDVRVGTTNYYDAELSVQTRSTAEKGIVIRALASQTANLQEWQDSAGTVITRIDSSGQNIWTYSIRPQVTPTSGSFIQLDSNQVRITQQTAGAVAFIVKGAASQTANLQEWQDSTGTVLSSINNSGNLILGNQYISNSAGSGYGRLQLLNGGTNQTIFYPASAGLLIANAGVAGMAVVKVRGASGQTANLQEWQDSAGTVLTSVRSDGRLWVGTATEGYATFKSKTYTAAALAASFEGITGGTSTVVYVASIGAAETGLAIRGAASQTANLQEWQDSVGAVIAKLDPAGGFTAGTPATTNIKLDATAAGAKIHFGIPATVNNYATLGAYSSVFNIEANARSILATVTNSTTTTTLIVKAIASQTANLQEWQNSAGTVLSRIRNDGVVIGLELRTTNNGVMVREESAGGTLTQQRATTTPANPGTNLAKIYFRDGTDAGTLKLVVRAGTAGAETTILDNIPQS